MVYSEYSHPWMGPHQHPCCPSPPSRAPPPHLPAHMYTAHNRSTQLGCQMGRLQMDPDFLMTLFEPTMVPIRAPFIPLFPEAATAAATLFSCAHCMCAPLCVRGEC